MPWMSWTFAGFVFRWGRFPLLWHCSLQRGGSAHHGTPLSIFSQQMELSPVHILQILMCYRDWLLSSLLRRTFIRQRGIGTMDWFLGSHVAPRCTLISLYRKKCCRTCRMITTILLIFLLWQPIWKTKQCAKTCGSCGWGPQRLSRPNRLARGESFLWKREGCLKWPWKSWEVTTNHEIWSNLEVPCFQTSSYMFEDFKILECVARVLVSLWGSGGGGCVRWMLRLRPQPFASFRNRSRMVAWALYGRAYGEFYKSGHFWSFQCRVALFCMACVALRDSPTRFITCWQSFCVAEARHFGDLHRHFASQVQHFRRVVLRAFCESHCQGCVKWRQVGCAENGRKPRRKHRFWSRKFYKIFRFKRKLAGKRRFWSYTVWKLEEVSHEMLVLMLHSTLYTPHFTFHTLHFTPHTLKITLYTWHSALHFTLDTSHSTLYTPHSTLYTSHSAFPTPHSKLYTPHSTVHTPHFTLHTLQFTLYTPHFTLHTLHSTLPHFILHTLHSTLYTPHSTLYTPHFTPRT